ncbi:GNAT family N-acetyltransferase [Streptomyces cinnamoneus]|uniref:GNAT family N-acetyltransferase n=1 Tax=Streptomyces cinnamoneus TaxID=53446 RepID=A0A2G1XPX3_STRCJ|nr:GNAT family N-acetyltransferase [Streptomyces cinnamoneus]PHQ53297.1 GNAT family N-acetyltransferase [Streptomyces cinnamoneus]PPT12394.1 GNAT family N-acetyltransferase [Streptomyces cinnamoneus]
MTTTLRPTAPERRTEDGGRSRTYEICVNSRPVGSVDLATDHRFGPRFGTIARLVVDEPDRGRGRGTVAALAAEEVLRGWGCGQVAVSIPASATRALGLAGALGYTERNRSMAKPLAEAPALPAGSTARPMTEEEFPAWQTAGKAAYAAHWADRGIPRAQALAKAERDHATALSRGPATPGAVLRVLTHGGEDVGTLWLAVRDGAAFVFDVLVGAAHRGRGHGRTLMRLAERESLAAGARTLGLNVFTDNIPALRLYESLGYEPTDYHLYKPLF